MKANPDKTLDDLEPVIERGKDEPIIEPSQVKPRSRAALQVYDRLQELKLIEKDPLFS